MSAIAAVANESVERRRLVAAANKLRDCVAQIEMAILEMVTKGDQQ